MRAALRRAAPFASVSRPTSRAFASPAARAMASPAAIICPSMLSSDFANLAGEAARMMSLGADWLHMDVMVRGERCG
jgi:hypothetical protein